MSFRDKICPGDIVVAAFPFTEKEESKVRTVLVLAVLPEYIWGLSITSSLKQDDGYAYELNSKELEDSILKRSYIRMNILQTIQKNVIQKKVTRVNNDCLERVFSKVAEIIGFKG